MHGKHWFPLLIHIHTGQAGYPPPPPGSRPNRHHNPFSDIGRDAGWSGLLKISSVCVERNRQKLTCEKCRRGWGRRSSMILMWWTACRVWEGGRVEGRWAFMQTFDLYLKMLIVDSWNYFSHSNPEGRFFRRMSMSSSNTFILHFPWFMTYASWSCECNLRVFRIWEEKEIDEYIEYIYLI